MRLGTQTNSVTNHIYSIATIGQPEPKVGMGVTLLGWTDRYPGTIVDVFVQGAYEYIAIQEDNYVRTDNNGFSESQTYEYSRNPRASLIYYRRKRAQGNDGRFVRTVKNENDRWVNIDSKGIRIGERERYWDPCF